MNTARGSSPATPPPSGPRRTRTGAPPGAGTKGVPRARREAQILAAAVEEFGRHGHASASMASIARSVGVTKPMLYTYFGSKDGLYLACLEHIASSGVPPRVLAAVFGVLEGQREAWFVLYDRTLQPGSDLHSAAHAHRAAIDRLAASGTAEVLRAQGNEDLLDADALKHVWTGAVGALVGWWISHPEQSATEMAARCARLLAAIRAPH
ncbi:TetR/AcrR family transcriptional regulator [Streptomyces durocortorensis]|uniref:TetR/AcrR family transcriptional regulator n=1 Tax=Streptomyces durocortorensis TaxID=2811104 RepID=A0ABS2HQB9_9ACTN|nr:TetR/AcrR family transcriptional regulator [Streptomyces durocortorensis]MBM7052900.1 TetR/AcrR family transcriptional regulator [Streptomyces durocortorensis]